MKSTLSLVVMLCLAIPLCAQETATSGKLKLSVFGGLNTSRNMGYLGDGLKSRPGFLAGININSPLSRSFEIQTRLIYESKRAFSIQEYSYVDQTDDGPFDMTRETTTTLNYLTLQIIPTFRFGNRKEFFIGAGGYYSHLHNGAFDQNVHNRTNGSTTQFETPVRYIIDKDFDAGFSLVAGYTMFVNKKPKLDFQVSYNEGLVHYHDYFNTWQQNRSLNFTIGYRLFTLK